MGADAANVFFRGERPDFMSLPVLQIHKAIMKHILILHPTVVVQADAEKVRIDPVNPVL